VPPGPVLSDVLIGSPIFQGEGGEFGGGGGGAEGGLPHEFGVDPNMDPELALALRVGLDEERLARKCVICGSCVWEEVASLLVFLFGVEGGMHVSLM